MAKRKRTNNELQNNTQKAKDCARPTKPGDEFRPPLMPPVCTFSRI